MGHNNGEGRASSEKGQRVIVPYSVRKAEELRLRDEEAEWAARSGPVLVRRKES